LVEEVSDAITDRILLSVVNSAVIHSYERFELGVCHGFVLKLALTHVKIAVRELFAGFFS
jgi:hypothetical protein